MSNVLINVFTRRTLALAQKLVFESLTRSEVLSNEKTKLCAVNCTFWIGSKDVHTERNFSIDAIREGSAARAETTSTTQGLSKLQAQELVLRLTDEERSVLIGALQEYHSKVVKEEYEGQLAASRWRSKFGRPSKLPTLGDVDPTGSYCPLPEDWLEKKRAEQVPRPTTKNLIDIAIANSIPFIGFGFLDNFFMLIFEIYFSYRLCNLTSLIYFLEIWPTLGLFTEGQGDYIDIYLGSYFVLTTMAAAAIGNTFSDILGIGTAFYVERLANKVGYTPPKLSPMQMDLPVSRNFANLGRVLGVTLGCILGMVPLLFFRRSEKDETSEEKNKTK